MSFILKALKKLEEERAIQAREPAELNRALLSADLHSVSRPRRLGTYLAVSLVFIAGIGATYFLARRPALPIVQKMPADAPATPRPMPASPPSTVKPAAKPAPIGPTISSTNDAHIERPLPRPKTRKMAATSPRQSVPAASQPRQQELGPATASLTVNGIAFQDDPADSMAVVNGSLVKTGMSIAGVQVERIFQDRVRFRGSGGSFEVQLTK
jgi:hypothetical protein